MLLVSVGAKAQFDAVFTNSWALQSFYNPAAAGLDGLLDVQAAYSMQMAGFENAPATMYVGADLPVFFLSPSHGMGAAEARKMGIRRENSVSYSCDTEGIAEMYSTVDANTTRSCGAAG